MIKVFEAFAGYGSQRMALKNLNIPHEIVGISEIDGSKKKCSKICSRQKDHKRRADGDDWCCTGGSFLEKYGDREILLCIV